MNNVRVLMNADLDGSVGGINTWAKHIVDYYSMPGNRNSVNLSIISDKRKDFTAYTKNSVTRIIDGIITYASFIIKLKALFDRNSYDVYHMTSSASLGLFRDYLQIRIAKRKRIKTILHFHFGRIPDLKLRNNWEWKLLLKVSRMANHVIVLDQKSYDILYNEGLHKVTKLPNPISPTVFSIISDYGCVDKRNISEVLYVGQCYRAKGVYDLVNACAEIPSISLKLIGSISREVAEDLERIAMGNLVLKINGLTPYEDTIKEMLHCGVFVLPSHSEGFPNVILESMACGCPIVTTEVGAIPEMLGIDNDSNCGICVKPHDVSGLRTAIKTMLYDRDYAMHCGQNAAIRVNEQYSMPIVWKELVNLWNNI